MKIIKNAKINNGIDSFYGDIQIEHGKIEAIGQNLAETMNGYQIIDAEGMLLIPGGVDVHTHLDLDLGKFRSRDDFYQGTVAAAYGGTTTIVDHIAFGPKGTPLEAMIENYHNLADGKAIIDYGFHGAIQEVNEVILEGMENLVRQGIKSFKIYMTYDGRLSDEDILKVLKKAKELDCVICVHAENHGSIQELRKEYGEKGKLSPIYHAKSRPNVTEAEAVNRMIYLSEIAGYPQLYFVHISTEESIDEIKRARERGAQNIFCETCLQYLILTEEKYLEKNDEGLKYICAPPLRQDKDKEALWKAVKDRVIDVIATDHCPFYFEEDKMQGKKDFRNAPGGIPGIEERMEIILSEGLRRSINISILIQLLSINPAKIMGIYPKKGSCLIGSDADFVLIEEKNYRITQENRHSSIDYTTYEGREVNQKIKWVMQRGEILVKDGQGYFKKGIGQYLERY